MRRSPLSKPYESFIMPTDADIIINDLKNHKENLPSGFQDDLRDYNNKFVQRWPSYVIKPIGGKNWHKKRKPLSDPPIVANLLGKYCAGTLARWYPEFFGIDIDNQPREFVDRTRESLRLYENNSILIPSESPDCYHLFGNPTFNGKPPSLNLLHSSFKSFAREHHLEIYPQGNRFFRLPFSPHFDSIDPAYYNLETWQEKLYWFNKLDDFDISHIPGQQLRLDLQYETPAKITSTLHEGKELYEHGLQLPSSRNDGQFKVLYYLLRLNIPQHQAVCMTWKWIKERHNGFSKDIIRYPKKCKEEIDRQASIIVTKYELSSIYPDSTNNLYHGWLTKPDIPEIIKITRGNMPRSNFLFYNLKYSYPRRHRDFINVRWDKLADWSSRDTYLKFSNEFESQGVMKRGSAYKIDEFSKSIKLNWKYGIETDALLDDGRSVDTLDDTLRVYFTPQEFRDMLTASGTERTTAIKTVIRTYGS